jgi:hypothetical protein
MILSLSPINNKENYILVVIIQTSLPASIGVLRNRPASLQNCPLSLETMYILHHDGRFVYFFQ